MFKDWQCTQPTKRFVFFNTFHLLTCSGVDHIYVGIVGYVVNWWRFLVFYCFIPQYMLCYVVFRSHPRRARWSRLVLDFSSVVPSWIIKLERMYQESQHSLERDSVNFPWVHSCPNTASPNTQLWLCSLNVPEYPLTHKPFDFAQSYWQYWKDANLVVEALCYDLWGGFNFIKVSTASMP